MPISTDVETGTMLLQDDTPTADYLHILGVADVDWETKTCKGCNKPRPLKLYSYDVSEYCTMCWLRKMKRRAKRKVALSHLGVKD